MTTRHLKQEERWQKRDLILDAVLKLGYWPAEWQIHLELSANADAQVWFRKRKKEARRVHLLLRLREDWLETQLHQGRAVVNGYFIMHHALMDPSQYGVEHLLWCEAAWYEGRDPSHGRGGHALRLRQMDRWMALYGGKWAEGDGPIEAADNAIRPFAHALNGITEEIPF